MGIKLSKIDESKVLKLASNVVKYSVIEKERYTDAAKRKNPKLNKRMLR